MYVLKHCVCESISIEAEVSTTFQDAQHSIVAYFIISRLPNLLGRKLQILITYHICIKIYVGIVIIVL